MPLTDLAVRKTKGADRARKLADEKGLFLLLTSSGAKYWRFKYRFAGREKLRASGVYPEVTLAEARERRDEARKLLARAVDPSAIVRSRKQASRLAAANSFEAIGRKWYAKHVHNWVDSHSSKILRRLECDVFPYIGSRPIGEMTAQEILGVLRRVERRGALDTAPRVHQNCSQIMRYAVAIGHAERDPAADLRGALPPARERHYPTITDPKRIRELMRAIEGYQGSFITRCALQLAPLVFVRPGELRRTDWLEINLDSAEWRGPAARMKMRAVHVVPLARQAVEILRELHPLTGNGQYLFPGARSNLASRSGCAKYMPIPTVFRRA